jgi:glycosyltransferase involved in cell wall biosynthesis
MTAASPGSLALVHDYLLVMRGAERTFAAMAECYPEAPIYTLLWDERSTADRLADRTVCTSPLQRLRVGQRGFRRLLPVLPLAVQRLPLAEYDVILSSSSAFAHGIVPRPDATHVCYCHSPFRYTWHERRRALAEAPFLLRPAMRALLWQVRRWDLAASRRVTHYVANSALTRKRIRHFYGRDAAIVHPPVEVERFHTGEPGDYFLVVSEIVAHKRVEIALEAARRAGQPIKVVGEGPELERLRHLYRDSADFLGRVPDGELVELYAGARALLMPNVEEFGIAAVEAQAAGRPVVATDAGGAQETVVDGETGVLVPPEDVDSFAETLRHTDFDRFRPERARSNARRFSSATFERRLRDELARFGVAPPVATPQRPLVSAPR